MTGPREDRETTHGASAGDGAYRGFWNEVGDHFPDLGQAASTAYYRACEKWLFEEFLTPLAGRRVLKTDLWDEAKNTRILRWAAGRGAEVHGIDLALPIAGQAAAAFRRRGLHLQGSVADVRELPYGDRSFDAVYSMGTIEHFDETEDAVAEIFRVLKPGGRAVIGVPNRHDPFLRPLLVALLYRLGLYGYGFEKSYSRRQLAQMCRRAGFEVNGESGILFIPGWLRMADLAATVWWRPLDRLTGLAVRPFAWLYHRFARVRRHGYLIVAVADRPR